MMLTNEQIDAMIASIKCEFDTPEEHALADQLASQAKAANDLRADAERYRHLRSWDKAVNSDNSPWCVAWQDADMKISAPETGEYLDHLVDVAIDAARGVK